MIRDLIGGAPDAETMGRLVDALHQLDHLHEHRRIFAKRMPATTTTTPRRAAKRTRRPA